MVIMRIRLPGVSSQGLSRFAGRVRRALKLSGVVGIVVTSSREMQRLNKRFRQKDKPTDVLSFPPLSEFTKQTAGDLAISAQIAATNARRLGHTTSHEIKILILHGMLHLAGYDHERDSGEMARQETRLRKALGLNNGLIERNANAPYRRFTREPGVKA
jgi:probable rRNA maturation factor